MKIGVISDTHGLIRPQALEALRGVDRILHAGDVGDPAVLAALGELAPVAAIRGNIDTGAWAEDLPETRYLEIAGVAIFLLHDLQQLSFDPAERGVQVVISGHSHRPHMKQDGSVLYLNPGSAGRRRFKLPITVARLQINAGQVSARIIELAV